MIQYLSFCVSSTFTYLSENDQIDFAIFKAESILPIIDITFSLHINSLMHTSWS